MCGAVSGCCWVHPSPVSDYYSLHKDDPGKLLCKTVWASKMFCSPKNAAKIMLKNNWDSSSSSSSSSNNNNNNYYNYNNNTNNCYNYTVQLHSIDIAA